ncbi:hypothetical protein AA98_2240 [Escherichia coli 2-011-08_S1_C1]|nr:hypothetical protein AA98_2240 [Escherichia coli 2-011-08_S1_C1]
MLILTILLLGLVANHFFLPDILQVSPTLLLLFLYQEDFSEVLYFQQEARGISTHLRGK